MTEIAIVIDGETKTIDSSLLLDLLAIQHSPYSEAYWADNHTESLSFDFLCKNPMIEGTVSLGDEKEVHQVDMCSCHHFSISKHRWGQWPTQIGGR